MNMIDPVGCMSVSYLICVFSDFANYIYWITFSDVLI